MLKEKPPLVTALMVTTLSSDPFEELCSVPILLWLGGSLAHGHLAGRRFVPPG